jgi:flavin reductase (DIM6/NTAB) family NADH-FMN oxidoreductase RutF
MENKKIIDHGVHVIAYIKDNKKYAMTCAWSMQCDYDKVLMLLGSQSVTGKNLKKGDVVGFSALSCDQVFEAMAIGNKHSDDVDKLDGIKINIDGTAITIADASSECICEVLDILHLNGIENDNLVYLKIISCKENNDNFLHMSDL